MTCEPKIAPCYKCEGRGNISVMLPVKLNMRAPTYEEMGVPDPVAETITCPVCHGTGEWTYHLKVESALSEHKGRGRDIGQEMECLRKQHHARLSGELGERLRGNPKFQEETFGGRFGCPYEFPAAVLAEETDEANGSIVTTFLMGTIKREEVDDA